MVFTFVAHLVAMAVMAAVLLPMMPGGPVHDDAERMRRIATHPWAFRWGWVPWQITAASDLWLAVALVRTTWVPRLPAWLALVATVVAVVPDQTGQVLWMLRGPAIAAGGDPGAYLGFETRVYALTAAWGAIGYTVAAVFWSWAFASAGTWCRGLGILSAVLWPLFMGVSVAPLLPDGSRPPASAVAAGNAMGFVLLVVWLAWVSERVFRRCRANTDWGERAVWRAPRRGAIGAMLGLLANSRFAKGVCGWLPLFPFASDITDLVHASWLVPAERLLPLVPEGLELARPAPGGTHAVVSCLTFRHGHFGPVIAGPLRRLFPSPIQTNWRVHVRDRRTGHAGIAFFAQGISNLSNGLGARLMSEGMPMHRFAVATLERGTDGSIRLALGPGAGSAPDAVAEASPGPRELPEDWRAVFATYDQALDYLVSIDRALSTQPELRRTTRQEIQLGLGPADCEALEGRFESRMLGPIVGDARPLMFRVARVGFRFTGQSHDAWTEA